MANVVQFRRSTAVLTLVAASIGGGLIAAFAVASHGNAPVSVTARADTSPASQRISSLSNSFADMIEKASPAVVRISSTRIVKASEQQQGNNPMAADPFFQRFFGGQGGAKPRDHREGGLGSGVIIGSDGYILTNNHVIDKATTLKINLSDGREFTGKLIGADPQTDVALVKIPVTGLPTLKYANSDAARVGDLCFAIGNPFDQDHTVTMGIVSAKGRKLDGNTHLQNFIQTDAAINPGNSGGALINANGDLIGMNTAILSGGGSSFGGEGGNIGIGFAVPSNMARQVTDQLMKNGKVSRGYMGVTLRQLSNEQAPFFGLKEGKGAIVSEVPAGKPGAKAGLQVGDVVTAIDGKKVDGSDDLTMEVISKTPGAVVVLDIMRNSQPMQVRVTLGQRPSEIDFDQTKRGDNDGAKGDDETSPSAGATVRGITVEGLSPEVAQQIGAATSLKGVVITDVDQAGPAAEVIGKGVVVTAVDRKPVTSVADFKKLMAQAEGKAVLITFVAGGTTGFAVVQPK